MKRLLPLFPIQSKFQKKRSALNVFANKSNFEQKVFAVIIYLVISVNVCFAGQDEPLPEFPWRIIVETQFPYESPKIWRRDISVKLFGNYTPADSVMVANSVAMLDSLTESISIKMTANDRGNMEIFFVDSSNVNTYEYIFGGRKFNGSTWTYRWNDLQSIELFSQALWIDQDSIENKQNFLNNTLAWNLYPFYWSDQIYYDKKLRNEKNENTIFRTIEFNEREKLLWSEMLEVDKQLLRTVYSNDFEERLSIARSQFKLWFIPNWLRQYSYGYLLVPFGILLILVAAIFISITKIINRRISNKLLRFNINGVIGLSMLCILGAFYTSAADALYNVNGMPIYLRLSGIFKVSALIFFVIGLPIINVFRLIEILIHKSTGKNLLRVVLIFLSTGLLPFLAFGTVMYFTNGERVSSMDMKAMVISFYVSIIAATIRALIGYFIFKEKDLIFENETKLSKLRELKTKAELNALHSRINPHFLYNSLNSIAGLAHEDANKTEHMALSLSKLFRYSINRDQSDWTSIKEELEMVRIYLDVEKVRFEDRLDYSLELPVDLEDMQIPRFMIQPLVENAVKHGISKSVEMGEIKVQVSQNGRQVIIAVSDNGPEFPNDLEPGFGIQSIYDKLEILYSGKFEMNFINTPLKQVLIKLN